MCMYGFYYNDPCDSNVLQVHHIKKRSQGGDDSLSNLITLCPKHHGMAERHEIAPEVFLSILEEFKDYA
jgi:predicted restriction endonuclease